SAVCRVFGRTSNHWKVRVTGVRLTSYIKLPETNTLRTQKERVARESPRILHATCLFSRTYADAYNWEFHYPSFGSRRSRAPEAKTPRTFALARVLTRLCNFRGQKIATSELTQSAHFCVNLTGRLPATERENRLAWMWVQPT